MRKIILLILSLCTVFSACQKFDDTDIWDSINSLDERVTALEKLCREMNTNINALQSLVKALENQDYITNVSPIQENGKVIGYTISFANGDPITIYHGQDGKDGQDGTDGKDGADGEDGKDGKDGQTPVIGVMQDTDGIYYWTLNGQWLLDDNGQKIKAVGTDGQDGENGNDGAPGQDGTAGLDGITPQLKIQDGKWFVSYDNGVSWIELGQATGDQGPQGNPGVGGDSMFLDVDYSSDSDYVIFVLSNGTEIKIPTWYAFEALKKAVEELNNNVEALRVIVQALENNDYVKGVTPLPDGSGYVIEFVKSGTVTIYHGKDGADGNDGASGIPGAPGADGSDGEDGAPGADGADGHSPVIAVAIDPETGDWCWTIDGEWLLDGNGNKVVAVGRDGIPGTPGGPGADGKDGVTPKFKIEDGYWYVSYDGGVSWELTGKATGDQGGTGATGDSMFDKIDLSDENYVIMVLTNGSTIKLPTWSAFEALKQQCEQMNANIEALQVIVNALQNNDYIKSITPIYEGVKEIGYIIEFTKSGKVTIYHGEDGKDGVDGAPGADGSDGADGANGVDGHTPIIGVAKDTDGIYYWTVDGSWLLDENGQKVKAVGTDGQNGSNGQDGATGTPGAPGADGQDGITPQLKIENGMWYVSYDNGANWIELGQATGDQGPQGNTGATGPQGPQGTPGVDGDAFFQSVDTSSSDYVTFVLANGTEIKVPTWSAFETLKQECEQMNANIEALQVIVNALQNNDYIKSITPIYEGVKEIGYIIEFTKSGKVTIYHGQDGHTPGIGVAKDTDGIYYWTVDGSWLLDENGQKVKAVGTDGKNGSNGSNGTNGVDGITPQLKIENGMWYVSYDNGASWIVLGQATGDQGPQGNTGATGPQGPEGTPGVDGDAFFQDVDASNSDYVIFVLANGTEIKVPTWLAFETLKQECEQMNANIEALQVIVNALQNNDYIKSITPIYEGVKEIGYIIEFTKSGKVTIYHGQDGHTPVIGVAKDTDGIYYWTVDGSWLLDSNGQKVKAVGTDGQNGSNGSNGQDGAPGAPGADGQDGITPQLKIENGLWFVSYDNGASWIELGQATGDQGPQGNTGDAFFQSVTETNDYVLMVLANGTEIKIPKYSAVAATLTLDKVTGFTATFNGQVIRHSLDLKVTVYYSTIDNLTVYKHKGKTSVTEFNGDTFTLRLTELAANTTYYYFTEVICNGTTSFSEISSFRTGKEDSYVDWGEGENVGGEI